MLKRYRVLPRKKVLAVLSLCLSVMILLSACERSGTGSAESTQSDTSASSRETVKTSVSSSTEDPMADFYKKFNNDLNAYAITPIPGIESLVQSYNYIPVGKGDSFIVAAKPDDSGAYEQGSYVLLLLDAKNGKVLHALSGLKELPHMIKTTPQGYISIGTFEIVAVDDNLKRIKTITSDETQNLLGNFFLVVEYYSFEVSNDLSSIVIEGGGITRVVDTTTGATRAEWKNTTTDQDRFIHTHGMTFFAGGNADLVAQTAYRDHSEDMRVMEADGWGYMLTKVGEKPDQTFVCLSEKDGNAMLAWYDALSPDQSHYYYIEYQNDSNKNTDVKEPLFLWSVDLASQRQSLHKILFDPFDGRIRTFFPIISIDPDILYISTDSKDGQEPNRAYSLIRLSDNSCETMQNTPGGFAYSENGAILNDSSGYKHFLLYGVMP